MVGGYCFLQQFVTLPNFLASSAPLATNQFQLDKKQSLLTQQINLLFSLLLAHNPPTAIGHRILGYPPRPHAILFVITRSLVHDGRPVRIPKWRSFIIKIESPLRLGRECAESRTSQGRGRLCPLDFHLLIPICAERDSLEPEQPLFVRQ
jgi:hypothetical protein